MIRLYINTIKHLRFIQIYYRLYYFVRNRFIKKRYSKFLQKEVAPITWENNIYNKNTYLKNNTFSFLNISHQFTESINWNFSEYGKLWTYNLNYFDFLNQKQLNKDEGLVLINDFIKNDTSLKDAKDPYPISLRGINWIKYLSINKISDSKINQYLYNDYQNLLNNLEYHLLGNHLLENGFSLLFGAYYFEDKILYKKAKTILTNELNEQILNDGAHFELSPMYHQILLYRLLDCVKLVQLNSWKEQDMLPFLIEKATMMLSWLKEITYKTGNIPMVNDSTYDIAPTTKELITYAKNIGLKPKNGNLSDSGYRTIKKDGYEFFVDVGGVAAKYQPGHAHADTFSFELYVKNIPIIVDTGISTYEKNKLRQKERGTESHNTVMIGGQDQSQVWDGFRVAKRAKIVELTEKDNYIKATHDGYKQLGILHTREMAFEKRKINIKDSTSKNTDVEQAAFFHFHPNIKNVAITDTIVSLHDETITFNFVNSKKIELEKYNYATGFNKTELAYKLKVYFCNLLETSIKI